MLEWIAALVMLSISSKGSGSPQVNPNWPAPWNYVYFNAARPVFGLCLSYLIVNMLTVEPKQSIAWYRPSCIMRYLLSARFWIPWAGISYSLYLWHLPILSWADSFGLHPNWWEYYVPVPTACPGGIWNIFRWYESFFWTALAMSVFYATLSYILIEKPGIDARLVYKNRFELEKLRQKRA